MCRRTDHTPACLQRASAGAKRGCRCCARCHRRRTGTGGVLWPRSLIITIIIIVMIIIIQDQAFIPWLLKEKMQSPHPRRMKARAALWGALLLLGVATISATADRCDGAALASS